jgi:(S)-ureidoglycine aminohydrolase
MKTLLLLIVFSIPFLAIAQLPVVPSKIYAWKEPTGKVKNNIVSAVLFEGSAYDMEYLQMSSNAITPAKKKVSMQIPSNEEHLLIIKTGILTIGFKDSTWSIGGGSVALLMPGEKYTLQNTASEACTFYRMKYRSKLPMDLVRGQASGGSFVKDWNKIPFKPHDKGGIRIISKKRRR